jgi:hypothetical protein
VKRVFPAVRASLAAASRATFRVIQFSVQNDHVHLIVEAEDREALSRGMRGLATRSARAVNRTLARRGRVWADRFHARPLRTPREVRSALVYVLMNFKKHWRGPIASSSIDRCSSAPWFDGFRRSTVSQGERSAPAFLAHARTWLARVGWRVHGLIGIDEGPCAAPA